MFSKLTGTDKFLDLLGQASFWFILAAIIGLIIAVVICIKHPKIGGPILASLFGVVLLVLDVYSIIQLNYYYNSKGGIYGALTGIFNTNEIEVVDDLSFEIKNIELTETSEGVYSASITTDQVLSLNTRESLGVFVNGMPCDTTSQVQSDYAIANYVYSFYDNNQQLICTDTLTLNFAFYERSTYLSLSTKGGTLPVEECVEYWHHYFNKNGFVIKIAPFNTSSTDISYSNGDLSNYVIVNYYVGSELFAKQSYFVGDEISLVENTQEYFTGWTYNGEFISEGYVIAGNMDLIANFSSCDVEFGGGTSFSITLSDGSTVSSTKMGDNFYTCTFTCKSTDYFVVEINAVDSSLNLINTDGEVSFDSSEENIYTVELKNASLLYMSFESSNLELV